MSCQNFSNLYKRVHLTRVARLIDSPWIPKQKEKTFHSLGITFECLLNGGRGRTSLKELRFGSEGWEELNTHTADTDILHILLGEILTEYTTCVRYRHSGSRSYQKRRQAGQGLRLSSRNQKPKLQQQQKHTQYWSLNWSIMSLWPIIFLLNDPQTWVQTMTIGRCASKNGAMKERLSATNFLLDEMSIGQF
jgi:hypothetical protein